MAETGFINGIYLLCMGIIRDFGRFRKCKRCLLYTSIIRLADWFGIEHIICSQNTVDVYNPKTIQATMGGDVYKRQV